MPRIALKLEYSGTAYHGWQEQKGVPSIQGMIEAALFKLLHENVKVHAAGRTDKGVHARGQVAHFDTLKRWPCRAYVFGLNHFLPHDIRVLTAAEVDPDFHARFSASYRRYEMMILNRPVDSALLQDKVLWHPILLDEKKMQEGADSLIGEQDFSSFRGPHCQAASPVRHLHFCNVSRQGESITINIQASGFLHNMVRNLTGVLLKIGEGTRQAEWARTVLDAKRREAAAKTVAPQGLYLVEIGYPMPVFTSLNPGER